jgi:starch phosphorylase
MHAQRLEFPNLPPRIAGLGDLASNLWWSWHPAARVLFKSLDRATWKESRHNAVQVLREAPQSALEAMANDNTFVRRLDVVLSLYKSEMEARGGWFADNVLNPNSSRIAYFSAEFGLHHSLPFFAGGLGFLAGDHVKECSDLGIPLVGVGFMYPGGYLNQRIREDGWQEDLAEPLNREIASIGRVLAESGQPLIVTVPLINPPIYVAVWRVSVGRVDIYLLDTDIPQNEPWNRQISARLYIGDQEQRLRQEIVLGLGGMQVLQALQIEHTVIHLNEGHPAFVLLERLQQRMNAGDSFEDAQKKVRATSIFTTHTPVPAGHDVFPSGMIQKYFGTYCSSHLGLDCERLMKLGRHPFDPNGGFNMTAFALRLTDYRNGVSAKHGEVARRMWQPLWPDLPEDRVPIDHITNGVHVRSWIEPQMELLFNEFLGPDWLNEHDNPLIWELVEEIPAARLWATHLRLKMKLISAIKEQARRRWSVDHANPSVIVAEGALLDPFTLTIGFARRFATYKRADLILTDIERLKRMLNNRWRPIQIIFAGKAHPADDPGKQVLQRVFRTALDPTTGGRIAFVEDYDEQLAQYMVHGVDVWLNNPLPPMEASGTSGMKAALNGVPNLSILDGWWIEGYRPGNGWAFGGEDISGDRTWSDSRALYDLLENEIIPTYYNQPDDGVPHEWVKVMKQSIKTNAAQFSARRMVKEYAQKFYAPALQA